MHQFSGVVGPWHIPCLVLRRTPYSGLPTPYTPYSLHIWASVASSSYGLGRKCHTDMLIPILPSIYQPNVSFASDVGFTAADHCQSCGGSSWQNNHTFSCNSVTQVGLGSFTQCCLWPGWHTVCDSAIPSAATKTVHFHCSC